MLSAEYRSSNPTQDSGLSTQDSSNAKPTGSALVVREGRVPLVRRAIEPARGAWDIPGGFLEHDEHPEAGAVRELQEGTGST